MKIAGVTSIPLENRAPDWIGGLREPGFYVPEVDDLHIPFRIKILIILLGFLMVSRVFQSILKEVERRWVQQGIVEGEPPTESHKRGRDHHPAGASGGDADAVIIKGRVRTKPIKQWEVGEAGKPFDVLVNEKPAAGKPESAAGMLWELLLNFTGVCQRS